MYDVDIPSSLARYCTAGILETLKVRKDIYKDMFVVFTRSVNMAGQMVNEQPFLTVKVRA
jgi:hypothetical protein